ncbi:MAG TPA: hypothetical protein VND45_14740 [Thermoanaerobaculia bacterium]|nr:hypothetical protein [Thermoanaerobaculia bacterium]
MALAALTVMLWILWSDTIRRHRPAPILYAIRVALYLIVAGILILNMVRHREVFSGTAMVVGVLAVAVGFVGAGYFARRLVTRR